MKRKASHLDSEVETWPSRSPLSDSSVGSFGSPNRTAVKPVPWTMRPTSISTVSNNGANLRTRKRFRDNRPDISMIHQNTLAKLYNAQKVEQSVHSESQKSFTIDNDNFAIETGSQQAAAQKSLHSFFNIRQPVPTAAAILPATHQQNQSPVNQCSDCGSNLRNHPNSLPEGQDMMDVDYHQEEDYVCVSCQRVVCDMCAVRGDQRICLECALPGAG